MDQKDTFELYVDAVNALSQMLHDKCRPWRTKRMCKHDYDEQAEALVAFWEHVRDFAAPCETRGHVEENPPTEDEG